MEVRPHLRRQVVRGILNKTVGHVPVNIPKFVSEGIAEEKITHAHAVFTGNIRHDGPMIGGGPKLTYTCLLGISDAVENQQRLVSKFLNVLKSTNLTRNEVASLSNQ